MLIILACSKRKKNRSGKAGEVYDGVFYQICRTSPIFMKMASEGHVYILSAKYGLIRWDEPIELYDLKMNRSIAVSLKAETTAKLKAIIQSANETCLVAVMGKDYRSAIDWNDVEIPVKLIFNKIGLMKKEFKEWLLSLPEVENG